MFSKPVLFGLLAAGCMAAAGGGAYLASRHHSTPALAAAGKVSAPPATTEHATPAPSGVAETETVVPEDTARPATEPSRAAAPSPATPTVAPAARARVSRTPPPAAAAPQPARASAPERPAASPPARTENDRWVGLERPWPSRPDGSTADPAPAAAIAESRPLEPEPPPPAEPAARVEELVVSADSVIGLQVETALNSESAKVEDRVEARTIRDVKAGDEVAVPAGSRLVGSVTLVERGGKIKERARLGIRFHTIVLANGTEVPIRTETVYREGAAPSQESAAKIGGAAVGGAILGAILGGTKGAVLGGAAGAAGGTAAVMASGRNAATLPAGATITVRLSEPATVTVER